MLSRIKKYMIGEALFKAKTVFDTTKVEVLFYIIIIHIIMYIVGAIPAIVGGYWLIVFHLAVGLALIVFLTMSLKRTGGIRLAQKIWLIQGIHFTLMSSILNNGEASFITYSFVILDLVVAFFLLGPFLRNIAITYFTVFIAVTVGITIDLIPQIVLPVDLTREHEFFKQPNIYAIIIALAMVVFIINRFVRSHVIAGRQLIQQREQVVLQKELLVRKTETMTASIALAAKLQDEIIIDWSGIDDHFYSSFHFNLPKEKLSGEIFWVRQKGNAVYFALVDTGEVGLAGAMLSYTARNALDQSLSNAAVNSPKSILWAVNSFISNSELSNNGLNTNLRITVCKFSEATNELYFAGVSQPIIIEMKGRLKTFYPKNHNLNHLNSDLEFDEVRINLAPGDSIYLFSDGISDGAQTEAGKPVDYSDFKSLLYRSSNEVFENRNGLIANAYKLKRKNRLQTDDITIVGLKI